MHVFSKDFAQPLRIFAESENYSMSDVAALTELPQSTISRLWSDPLWLNRIHGWTLQKLLLCIPGLESYILCYSINSHFKENLSSYTRSGIDLEKLQKLLAHNSMQNVFHSLRIVDNIAQKNLPKLITNLGRSWSHRKDVVIDIVWDPNKFFLSSNVFSEIVNLSQEILTEVAEKKNSLQANIATNILLHKLIKHGHKIDYELKPRQLSSQSVFIYRAQIIGDLLYNADHDSALRYTSEVKNNLLLKRNELWSFGTYSLDFVSRSDYSLPKTAALSGTAQEILRDFNNNYNTAYTLYLILTVIPIILDYDPTFGGKKQKLIATLQDHLQWVDDKTLNGAVQNLLKSLL